MLVADVAGHGGAVAETASQLRTLMRKFVNFHDQRRLIAAINRQFIPLTPAGRFATAVLLTYDADVRELSLSNAGHPWPAHYSREHDRWTVVGPATTEEGVVNIPLGIGSSRYEQSPVVMRPGDVMLCYTDGLIEARKADGELLGAAGLLELVGSIAPAPPETFLSRLAEAVRGLNPGNATHDDITMLLLSPNPESRAPGFVKRLVAPIRYVAWLVGLYHPRGERQAGS
jgi:sigma-B regulation protein RsbU (phosphoserine phosphatase)